LDGDKGMLTPALSEVRKGINLPEWLPVMGGDMKSLVNESFHYIRNGKGHEELFDLQTDPREMNNLAQVDNVQPVLDRFRHSLNTQAGE